MCLGVPGEVVRWIERDGPFARAEVRFAGVRRVCHMACVPEAEPGDYVIVHAGLAISRIDPQTARSVWKTLESLGEDLEIGDGDAIR